MAQIVNSHVIEPCGFSDVSPRLLEIREIHALARGSDDVGVSRHAPCVGQNLQGRSAERDDLGSGLRVRKVDAVAPDVVPFQSLDFRETRSGVQEQTKRGHGFGGERFLFVQGPAEACKLFCRQEAPTLPLLVLSDMVAGIGAIWPESLGLCEVYHLGKHTECSVGLVRLFAEVVVQRGDIVAS